MVQEGGILVLAAKAAADSQRKILWRHGQKGSSKLPDTNLQIQNPIVGKDYPINRNASGVIMRIMDVVGESDLMAVKGKNIRIAYRGLIEPVTVIGNIIDDEWFDYRSVKF